MTPIEFDQGLAILSSFGAPAPDEDTQQLWMETLIGLAFERYRKAIIELCKTKTTFYPTDNIPALILEKVDELKSRFPAYHRAELVRGHGPSMQGDPKMMQELNQLAQGIFKPLPYDDLTGRKRQ